MRTSKLKRIRAGVPKRKLIRRWLNRRNHHSTAFVYSLLTCEEYLHEKKDGVVVREQNFYGDLNISDCSRQITLDIAADQNTIDKLDTLLKTLEEIRTYVVEAMEWMDG